LKFGGEKMTDADFVVEEVSLDMPAAKQNGG